MLLSPLKIFDINLEYKYMCFKLTNMIKENERLLLFHISFLIFEKK